MIRDLPDEIWVQVLEYLSPTELLPLQKVCRRLLKVARDSHLWRVKCFEGAPSATQALTNTDALIDMLGGLSIGSRNEPVSTRTGRDSARTGRRARALAKWDCTDPSENIDWYSEYIARNGPLFTEWHHHGGGNEIRSMALFNDEQRIVSAMEDGSVSIFDINISLSGRRNIATRTSSAAGLLFTDPSAPNGRSSHKNTQPSSIAIDSTVVDWSGDKAYIATRDILHELDLRNLLIVSQKKYSGNITAISQTVGQDNPIMIGTSDSLHMYDPRLSSPHRATDNDSKLETEAGALRTVHFPNYDKTPRIRDFTPFENRVNLDTYASLQPGPQTIIGYGQHQIAVAGRIPSILFYDRRNFPRLQSVIHSGSRLSSLTIIPHPPAAIPKPCSADATLVAAGEYQGRGSLEIYELPHVRATDKVASTAQSTDKVSPAEDAQNMNHSTDGGHNGLYSLTNRQSSSSSKLLSLASQGARITYSDGDGNIYWVERDGRGLARRWNINQYAYSHQHGALVGDAVARKITTFYADSVVGDRIRGDGDILFWTGSDLGIVSSKLKLSGHDELVKAFEEQMTLEDSPEGAARRSEAEKKQKEENYSRVMRRALERQADERRFLARFGRMR